MQAPNNEVPLVAVASLQRVHLSHLDGLRAVAALWVLMLHLVTSVELHVGPLPHSVYFVTKLLFYGRFAVPVFIVISGYCLMLPHARKEDMRLDAMRFYLKRARRILPPYYVAVLLFTVLSAKHTTWDVVSHLLLIHNLSPKTYLSINGSLWSVAVECQIYLIFPLLLMGWKRMGSLCLFLLVFLTCYGLQIYLDNKGWGGLTSSYVVLFLMGAIAAMIAHNLHPRWEALRTHIAWNKAGGAMLLVSILIMQFLPIDPLSLSLTWTALLIAAVTACLLIGLSRDERTLLKDFLSWRPLVTLGVFSYSIYLIHQPFVIWLVVHGPMRLHLGPTAALGLLTLFAVPVIISFAYVFHLVCERPFMVAAKPV